MNSSERKHIDGDGFDFLIGKKIEKVTETSEWTELLTTDGTKIIIETNEGCGGCENGWSSIGDLKVLENSDNAITNVSVEYDKWDDDLFKLFIYFHDTKFEVDGDDWYGNGYYGGGFWVTLKEEQS